MPFGALNRGRYNFVLKARARSLIGGPRVHAIDARISKAPPIRRLPFRHVSCVLNKNRVELSPTREKLREIVGFIRINSFRGLINLSR